MARSLDEIRKDMEQIDNMPIKPNFKRPKEGDVIDEEKSVVWNRGQVIDMQIAYDEACCQLKAAKSEKFKAIRAELHEAIVDEVGGNIREQDARAIYEYAWQENHSYGYHDVFCMLSELIELVSGIVNHTN